LTARFWLIVGPMRRGVWRRGASVYFALFFAAVAAAPHYHLNGLEDLLLDERSDSGVLTLAAGPEAAPGSTALNPFVSVKDVPCLACFTQDFFCSPASAIVFVPHLERLEVGHPPAVLSISRLVPRDTSSRAPPSFS
jgi:hypothetical protein